MKINYKVMIEKSGNNNMVGMIGKIKKLNTKINIFGENEHLIEFKDKTFCHISEKNLTIICKG